MLTGDELDHELERQLCLARDSHDQQSFTALYRLLAGKVAGYLRARGVRDVDDVVNEVFLGAFRNLQTFAGDGAGFRAWLFGIAHHKATDWLRRASRIDEVAFAREDDTVGGNSENEAVDEIERSSVARLLSSLTDDQRDVLMLRVVADLSLEQTATTLGKPVGAIKSIQHRALAALRRNILPEAVSG